MRTWKRAERDYLCGGCRKPIQRDAAVQIIELPNVKRVGYRGECCAGFAPPDIPAAPVFAPMTPSGMVQASSVDLSRTRGGLKAFTDKWLPHAND